MGRKYLGSHLCIITRNPQAKKYSNDVVIFAHGAQLTGQTFTLPGSIIFFYCPQGDYLMTNNYLFLERWASNHWYSNILSMGDAQCPDYTLSKAIGFHTDPDAAALGKQGIDRLVRKDPLEARNQNLMNYDAIEKLVNSGRVPFDVVSIRHRRNSDAVTLSYVINKLLREGYAYGQYHCLFCRGAGQGGIWDVELEAYA
jgi:hypothetical protein